MLMWPTKSSSLLESLGTIEELIVKFAGDNNIGIFYALDLCRNLKQLVIRGTAFGDVAFIADALKFKKLQFAWICSGRVSIRGCKILKKKLSTLCVEIKDLVGEVDDMAVPMVIFNMSSSLSDLCNQRLIFFYCASYFSHPS